MQKRTLLFSMLVVALIFSAGMIFFNRALIPNPGEPRSTSSTSDSSAVDFWKKKKGKTASSTNGAAVVYKTNQFRWNQLESADYREYIANLRGVGCPEATIRDIIITDIMRLYAARRGQFYHTGRAFKFWETDEKRKLKARQLEEREKQLASIDKEIPAILRDLLGINYEREINKYFVDTDEDNRRLSFLSQDKRDAILALREEIEGMREKLQAHAENGNYSEADLKELAKIEEHRKTKLAELLSGPELQDFELATSETADRLRRDLVGFNPSEDEFRELFRLQKEHDEKFALANTTDENAQKEKDADQQRIEAEILSKMSVARAQEYERAKNPDYRNLSAFSEVYELPSSTTQTLFEMEQAVRDERQKLLATANLTDAERAEGLKAIEAETEKSVRHLIGDLLYGKFTQSAGGWIQNSNPN